MIVFLAGHITRLFPTTTSPEARILSHVWMLNACIAWFIGYQNSKIDWWYPCLPEASLLRLHRIIAGSHSPPAPHTESHQFATGHLVCLDPKHQQTPEPEGALPPNHPPTPTPTPTPTQKTHPMILHAVRRMFSSRAAGRKYQGLGRAAVPDLDGQNRTVRSAPWRRPVRLVRQIPFGLLSHILRWAQTPEPRWGSHNKGILNGLPEGQETPYNEDGTSWNWKPSSKRTATS